MLHSLTSEPLTAGTKCDYTFKESTTERACDTDAITRVIVRTDMPLGAQMAQAAHAAMHLAAKVPQSAYCPIAMLQIDNEQSLLALADRLESEGIDFELFYEPDWPKGHSALALYRKNKKDRSRRLTDHLALWQAQP